MPITQFEVVARSRKTHEDIHVLSHHEPFFPYEAFDYARAREVMLGLHKRLPGLSLPGCGVYLMVRPVRTVTP